MMWLVVRSVVMLVTLLGQLKFLTPPNKRIGPNREFP